MVNLFRLIKSNQLNIITLNGKFNLIQSTSFMHQTNSRSNKPRPEVFM